MKLKNMYIGFVIKDFFAFCGIELDQSKNFFQCNK